MSKCKDCGSILTPIGYCWGCSEYKNIDFTQSDRTEPTEENK
jgi:uncharacterized OB-fold protein